MRKKNIYIVRNQVLHSTQLNPYAESTPVYLDSNRRVDFENRRGGPIYTSIITTKRIVHRNEVDAMSKSILYPNLHSSSHSSYSEILSEQSTTLSITLLPKDKIKMVRPCQVQVETSRAGLEPKSV